MLDNSNLILLAKLGIFIKENALNLNQTLEFLQYSKDSDFSYATVRSNDDIYSVNQIDRKTKIIELNKKLDDSIKKILLVTKPEVENHFNLTLSDCQEPQLLKYEVGDFFKRHVDRSDDVNAAGFSKKRLISTVIFLNSQKEKPEENCFGGGSLLFYGLMKSSNSENVAIPLHGTQGLMVCFNSNLIHEVVPVTHGTRYTLVSWYT